MHVQLEIDGVAVRLQGKGLQLRQMIDQKIEEARAKLPNVYGQTWVLNKFGFDADQLQRTPDGGFILEVSFMPVYNPLAREKFRASNKRRWAAWSHR